MSRLPLGYQALYISAVMKCYLIALGGACAFTEMRTALLSQAECATQL